MYDYRAAIRNDIVDFINENYTKAQIIFRLGNIRDAFVEELHDELWDCDSVTGNASGSYTFSTFEAEENLCHNFDLIEETASAFGYEPTINAGWGHGAEWWDVAIRCYLLDECIEDALDYIDYCLMCELGMTTKEYVADRSQLDINAEMNA